ncbi:MAG: hypothetical protein IPM07_19185 [Anaerolineales bacterium]|nr:hypothetical protein [Anaerolineales bacterium]
MTATLPTAYWDGLLMRLFPGKTLEELDNIDWPRLMRVLQVRQIEQIEQRLPGFFQGKWQPTAAEWRLIQRHDRILEKNGDKLIEDA